MMEGRNPGGYSARRALLVAATLMVALSLGVLVPSAGHGGLAAPMRAAALTGTGAPGASVIRTQVPGLFGTRGLPPVGSAIAFGAHSVWVLGGQGVVRLSAATGRVQADIRIAPRQSCLMARCSGRALVQNVAFAAGHLWAESVELFTRGYLLSEIDPARDRVVRTLVVDGGPRGVAQQGMGGNYQTLEAQGSLLYLVQGWRFAASPLVAAIDAVRGKVLWMRAEARPPLFAVVGGRDRLIPVRGRFASAIAAGDVEDSTLVGTRIWAAVAVRAVVGRPIRYQLRAYSAQTGTWLGIAVRNDIWLVAGGEGQLWGIQQAASSPAEAWLCKIDPATGQSVRWARLPVSVGGGNPVLAVGDGAVWVVEPSDHTVYRVRLSRVPDAPSS